MRPRVLILFTTATLLTAACSADAEPMGYEELPATQATAQAGVDVVTTGPMEFAASCGGTAPINCPSGTPGAPVYLMLTRAALTIQETTPGTFSFVADVAITTPVDIPVTIQGTACGLRINTAPGTSPTARITGTAVFARQTIGGPIDRLDVTAQVTQNLETADITITGSAFCLAASSFVGFFVSTLQDSLQRVLHLCGARGTPLFVECTPPALSRQSRRIV